MPPRTSSTNVSGSMLEPEDGAEEAADGLDELGSSVAVGASSLPLQAVRPARVSSATVVTAAARRTTWRGVMSSRLASGRRRAQVRHVGDLVRGRRLDVGLGAPVVGG